MSNTNAYWIRRAEENEEFAAKMARQASKRMKKLHKDTYKTLKDMCDKLQLKVNSGETLTRSELWRMKEYVELMNGLKKECDHIAVGEIDELTETLDKAFDQTIHRTMDQLKTSITEEATTQLKEQLLKSHWAGSNYSDRIWHNTEALKEKLEKHITDYIMTGKNPTVALSEELGVSYRQADRVVRTETAYIQTKASVEGYKTAGIEEVEFIAESDCCEECEKYSGKTFVIGHEPLIPVHPNCRCCLAPIVKKHE